MKKGNQDKIFKFFLSDSFFYLHLTPQGTIYILRVRLMINDNECKSIFQIMLKNSKEFSQRSIYGNLCVEYQQGLFIIYILRKSKNIYK